MKNNINKKVIIFDTGYIDILGMNYLDGSEPPFLKLDPGLEKEVTYLGLIHKDFRIGGLFRDDIMIEIEKTNINNILKSKIGYKHRGSAVFYCDFSYLSRIFEVLKSYDYAILGELDLENKREISKGVYYISIKSKSLFDEKDFDKYNADFDGDEGPQVTTTTLPSPLVNADFDGDVVPFVMPLHGVGFGDMIASKYAEKGIVDWEKIDKVKTNEKDIFEAYDKIRKTGKYNMVTQSDQVIKQSGLTQQEYFHVINNYDALRKKYSELKIESIKFPLETEIELNIKSITKGLKHLNNKFETIKDLVWGDGGLGYLDDNTPWSTYSLALVLPTICDDDTTDEIFMKPPTANNIMIAIFAKTMDKI